MSANLLDGATVTRGTKDSDGYWVLSQNDGTDKKDSPMWRIDGQPTLTENQTIHMACSVMPDEDLSTNAINIGVRYKDAAGNSNWTGAYSGKNSKAGVWTRLEMECVVPSGMCVNWCVLANAYSHAAGAKVTGVTISYGSPVCLASSAHTPYATQDHVAATYAPKSHKHAMADVTGLQAALDGIAEGVYPVGSLYLNATDATNPHDLLGFGTWAAFGQGRMLLSASDAHEAGATGGSETVALTAEQMPGHTHTATTSSAGAHTHTATTSSAGAHTHNTMAHQTGNEKTGFGLVESTAFVNRPMVEGNNNSPLWTSSNGAHSHSLTTASSGEHHHTLTTASAGGGKAHNNMPPYITVYMWVRTA